MQNSKPLASIFLLSFNQQRFIKEALLSAFSQDYDNLEIIISDDCSTDETYNIINDLCSKYDGPHKLIVNRNNHNLGIAGHINKVFKLSSGHFIFFFAGDDISLNNRITKCLQIFNEKSNVFSVFTYGIEIDEVGEATSLLKYDVESNGLSLNDRIKRFSNAIPGYCHAIRREVFTKFGPLLETTINEDEAFVFRSLMLGQIHCIHEFLVKRRIHSNNVFALNNNLSYHDYNTKLQNRNRYSKELVKQYIVDLKRANYIGLISDNEHINGVLQLNAINKKLVSYSLYYSKSYLDRVKGATRLIKTEKKLKRKIRMLLGGYVPFFNLFLWCLKRQKC